MYKTLTPLITQKQSQSAQALLAGFSDTKLKKRAFLDFIGAFYLMDFLKNSGLRVNTNRSIFTTPKLYLDFEMVDIYCNSHNIYVLTTYGMETVRVPSIHKRFNILPEAYVVVDLKLGMKEAEVKGAIFPEDLNKGVYDGKYFRIGAKSLRTMGEFYDRVKKYAGIKSSVGRHLECMNLFSSYIENKINENDKKKLIEHILSCDTCKKKLIDQIALQVKTAPLVKEQKQNTEQNEAQNTKNYMSSDKTVLKDDIKENKTKLKGAIDLIYKGEGFSKLKEDAIQYKCKTEDFSLKTLKIIIGISSIVMVLIIAFAIILNLPSKKSLENNKNVQGTAFFEQYDERYSEDTKKPFVPNFVKSNGYTTVSKVAWEVSSKSVNDSQKKFLQTAGKSIRLNLQNDLLLSNEVALNNRVKFDLRFLRDGNLESITISESSGTVAVDQIIKQSVQNTLYYMRPPKNSFVGKKNGLTLVVDF